MKRKVFFLSIFFLFVLYYVPILYEELLKHPSNEKKYSVIEVDQNMEEEIYPLPVTGFENYIGYPIENYIERHGQPSRIGPSNSGDEWWVFGSNQQEYVQIEVKNTIIQSIFVMGEKVNTGPIRIGMTRENIYDETGLAKNFSFQSDGTDYQLSLTKEDFKVFPLIHYENNSFAMLFFQPERDTLYGLRFLSADALLQTNYYHVSSEEEDGPSFVYSTNQAEKDSISFEKEEQLLSFFSIIRTQDGLHTLVQTNQMEQLGEDIIRTTGENTHEGSKSIEELQTYDKVKEMEYIKGHGIMDTPTQFGMFMNDSDNRKLLLNETLEELSIKTMQDDFLLLFN